MKHFLLSLMAIGLMISSLKAQDIQRDTVSLGPSYAQQVWYSLEKGVVATANKSEWHLAFDMSGFGSTIRINGSIGMQLYMYPEPGIEEWENLDTFGLEFWDELIDSEEDWSLGAFSQAGDPDDDFDLGWGTYSIVTHTIVGDRLFVLKTPEDNYYKIWIERLAMGTFTFHVANLDDGVVSTIEIPKAPYNNKNFVYFSLDNMDILDREPPKTDWDLVFTQYVTQLPTPYVVSGVLQNIGVQATELHSFDDINDYVPNEEPDWQDAKNILGFDWKDFNLGTFSWILDDSLIFVIKDVKEQWWSLQFTGFGGSSNGNFIFEKKLLDSSTSTVEQLDNDKFNVSPNPASDFIQVDIFNLHDAEKGLFQLFDMSGRVVMAQSAASVSTVLTIDQIPSGTYILQYQSPTQIANKKVIIK